MGDNAVELTKTRWYVITDLLIRVISSAALIILGVAGWHLQQGTAQAQKDLEDHDREERQFLPMLQSLSELQLVAQSVVDTMHG